jgi:hypothetical protein
MAAVIAGQAIKAAVKPILKQIVKNGVKGLLSKAFKKKLLERVKNAIMRKIRSEARKGARDQREDFMDECIESVLNDDKEMSDISDKVEEKMSDWLDSRMKFSPWDVVPLVGEVRMIQQMTNVLKGSDAEKQSQKFLEEIIEEKAKMRLFYKVWPLEQSARLKKTIGDTKRLIGSLGRMISKIQKKLGLQIRIHASTTHKLSLVSKMCQEAQNKEIFAPGIFAMVPIDDMDFGDESQNESFRREYGSLNKKAVLNKIQAEITSLAVDIRQSKRDIREYQEQRRKHLDGLAGHVAALNSL